MKNTIYFNDLIEEFVISAPANSIRLENAKYENQEKLHIANAHLLSLSYYLEKLYSIKGITRLTAETLKIGIADKGAWQLPIFKYDTAQNNELILGFKYYSSDFTKEIDKKEDVPASLSMINKYSKGNTDYLLVAKDYFDCYTFFQYFGFCGDLNRIHIVTSTHGINCLPSLLSEIHFAKYKKFLLFLGDDENSRKIEEEIMYLFPMFTRVKLDVKSKSFSEYFLKYLKPLMPTPKY